MRVSLVMPTLNGGDLLAQVLAAVDRQPGAHEIERVAVDSGSTDDTVSHLERHGFTVHGIDKKDFNHGKTRDLGIGRTTGDIILLLTQDAVPADENWMSALVATYDDPAVAAAYCRQIPRADCNPLIRERILQWTAGRMQPVLQRLGEDPASAQAAFDAMEPMQRLQTCAYDNVAGSLRRSVWEQIPFGSRRFGEDVAFGKRVLLAGHAIAYEPRSAVVHSHNRSPKDEGKRIFCDHENLRELFDIHLIPTYRDYKSCVQSGKADFDRILDGLELPPDERARVQEWADQYAKWSALGIFLGGNARRFRRGIHGLWFGRVERHLRKGI